MAIRPAVHSRVSASALTNVWQNITIALKLKAVFLATTLLGVISLWMAT